jgi:D-psicose/D-tagatose/L-ribulose 3-epimerase
MRLGINTVLWFWPFDPSRTDIFKKIADIGFETVEFALVDRSPGNIKKIRDALDRTGLECVIDGVVGGEKDILSPDENIMKAGQKYLFESIDLCQELGCRYLIGPIYSTGIKDYLFDAAQRKKSVEQAAGIIRELADYAGEKGIVIAIEPLNRYETNFVNTTGELKQLIDSVDKKNVGFQIDTFHANIEEKSIYDAVLLAGKKLFHMHAPESDRGTPGTGVVEWEAVAAGLKEIGYSHNIDIEIAHPHVENIRIPGAIWRKYDHEPDEMAGKGFDFLKDLLK